MADTWKRWLFKGIGFGVGFALALCVVLGIWSWYSSRPKPPKAWNDKAITAEFDYVGTTGDKYDIAFAYTLVNNTDFDFRVENADDVEIAGKLEEENSISKDSNLLTGEFPVFVPARGRARFRIIVKYPYDVKLKKDATTNERHDWRIGLAKYVTTELSNLDGFAIFYGAERYKIVFPSGWKKEAKDALSSVSTEPQQKTKE